MALATEFVPLQLEDLHREAAVKKVEGWRFIQTHAVNTDDGVDLYYSFMKNGCVVNYRVEGVKPDQAVPSITDLFLAAFVFENEARELFGVDMRDIAIDFAGAMYAPAEQTPMTFISPEQKAAREKAKKAAAAKAAKEAAATDAGTQEPATGQAAKRGFVMTPERRARLDAKLATMSPDKVAKVEAALKAREAEAAASSASAPAAKQEAADSSPASNDAQVEASPAEAQAAVQDGQQPLDKALEAQLALMPADKVEKVRAALSGTRETARQTAPNGDAAAATGETAVDDADLEAMLALMDPRKADKVRAAFIARNATQKGGE